jgi:hypothetical protein
LLHGAKALKRSDYVRQSRRGQSEQKLSSRLSWQYLFDAGYNPLLNPDTAGIRPDILDTSDSQGTYVECKQFSDVTKSDVQRAVRQARDGWAALAKRFSLPEAVLTIFRVAGKRLEFSEQELRLPEGRLLLQVVDIGPPEKRGHHSPKVLTLSSDDLVGTA